MPARPVGIVVAVREEFGAIVRRLSPSTRSEAGDDSVAIGRIGPREAVVVRAGMGAERAEAAVHRVVLRDGAAQVVIAGFCAGLAAGLSPGDLVVATRVESRTTRSIWIPHAGAGSSGMALRADVRLHAGPILTAEDMAPRPEAKRALAAEHPEALALDMETAGAARAASELRIPWIAVRAVTDGLRDPFPFDFARFEDPRTGDIRRSAVVAAALSRPWLVPALIRLGLRSARAARNLADFVEHYVSSLAAPSAPRPS